MDIDKDLIGKPPNQAIVINEQLIKREETYGKVSDQGKCDNSGTVENKISQVPELDTREKLEADICECINARSWDMNHDCMISCLVDWLDRQAAITWSKMDDTWQAQRKRIAELTAERDELNMRINGLVGELGDIEGTALSLQAKCDDLRSRLKTQANSFQKLERDNAKLRDTLARVRELVGDAE